MKLTTCAELGVSDPRALSAALLDASTRLDEGRLRDTLASLAEVVSRVSLGRVAVLFNPELRERTAPAMPGVPESLAEHLATERRAILDALAAEQWDRSAAADRLGMSRRTFYRRLSEYGLIEGAKPRGLKGMRQREMRELTGQQKGEGDPAASVVAIPARTGPRRPAEGGDQRDLQHSPGDAPGAFPP
jgi:hypothetical protein